MGNVTVQRLGTVKVGSDMKGKFIDPAPIVLWSKNNPSAIFYYQQQETENSHSFKSSQHFKPLCGDGFRSVSYHGSLPKDAEDNEMLDLVELPVAADINGDGMEELILPRHHGGVEVFGAGKKLFEFSSPSHDPKVGFYRPKYSYIARLKNRDVVYLLFDLEVIMKNLDDEQSVLAKHGLSDTYVILQIDQHGIKRIVLGDVGWKTRDVYSVGAINLPGSDVIDELLVVEEANGRNEAYLTRYRTDGQLIEQPRKIYVPFSTAGITQFEFLPQSEKAVIVELDANLYFVAPRKPSNWIRHVDLKKFGDDKVVRVLQTTDIQSDPKSLVWMENEIYAVNEEGKTFTFEKGAWVESKEPRPLYQINPISPLHSLVDVLPSETNRDQFLVIQSRDRQTKALSREELLTAAEKFMRQRDLEREKKNALLSLEDEGPLRDSMIEEERVKSGLSDKPRSIEDWKKRFPESYNKFKEFRERNFYVDLSSYLFRPIEDWPQLDINRLREDYRNADEYLEWLQTITIDAETSFTLVTKNASTATFQVPGYFPSRTDSKLLRNSIEYRASGSEISIITMLQGGDTPDTKEIGFYFIQHH